MLTETYSPTAMLIAPAARPASPAVSTAPRSAVAAATPMTRPAVETMPSLAPSTPARSQFRRPVIALVVGLVVLGRGAGGDSPTDGRPFRAGRGGDAVRELDVELGEAAGVVRA